MWDRKATSCSWTATMRAVSGPTISIRSTFISEGSPTLARPPQDSCAPTTSLARLAASPLARSLATRLKPFPFQTVTDNFGYVGNSNYNALQVLLSHAHLAWTDHSAATTPGRVPSTTAARSAPAIRFPPARSPTIRTRLSRRIASNARFPPPISRSTLSSQPFGTWPFGKTILRRATPSSGPILGGFTFSGVYQAYSGSPLAITESTCQTNPAQVNISACRFVNPNFGLLA